MINDPYTWSHLRTVTDADNQETVEIYEILTGTGKDFWIKNMFAGDTLCVIVNLSNVTQKTSELNVGRFYASVVATMNHSVALHEPHTIEISSIKSATTRIKLLAAFSRRSDRLVPGYIHTKTINTDDKIIFIHERQ